MSTIIDYTPETDLFQFHHPGNVATIWGISRRMTPRGMAWEFRGSHPGGMLSLKDLKAIDPDCKAMPAALKQIGYLKSVEDLIREQKVLNESGFEFKVNPKPHQPDVIEMMYHTPALALLLDRGLGKTFITLNLCALLKHLGEPHKMLVLGPKIVLKGWEVQALEHTDLTPLIFRGTLKQKRKLIEQIRDEGQPDLIMTNYETLVAHRGNTEFIEFLGHELDFGVLCLDEFSRLANPTAKRSKNIKAFAHRIPRRYGLSGTLSGGSPLDVYNPMTTLDSRIFVDNFWRFKNQHCVMASWNQHVIEKFKSLDKMKRAMDPFVIIKTKDDCLDLEDQVFADVFYDVSRAQKDLYNEVVRNDEVEVGGREVSVSMAAAKITKMLQILSGFFILPIERDFPVCNDCPNLFECVEMDVYPWNITKCIRPDNGIKKPKQEVYRFRENPKLDALADELEDIQEPIIIWAYFKEEIRQLRELLDKKKIKYITPETQDCDVIFQNDMSYQVFLGQISQGIGITLTRSARTRFYSLTTVLTDYLQAIDRNYRIGQTKKVLVEHTYRPGAIDNSLLHLLGGKQDVADFINTKAECLICQELQRCQKMVIAPYAKGCRFYGNRKVAEQKNRLDYGII